MEEGWLTPSIVHSKVVLDSLHETLSDLREGKRWMAYEKLKLLVDSLVSICCTSEDGEPLSLPETGLKVRTELDDVSVLDDFKKTGACKVKIDLARLGQDLDAIRYRMELNKYDGIIEDLEKVLLELGKLSKQTPGLTGSKYELFGNGDDLVLQARTEVNRLSKTLFAKYIEEDECKKLLEKYIEQAYELGQKEKIIDERQNKRS